MKTLTLNPVSHGGTEETDRPPTRIRASRWRTWRRIGGLAWIVARSLVRGPGRGWENRARWLQVACQRALRVLDVPCHVSGPVPRRGLLVCNHLSYLDILLLSATTRCLFVSKSEVRRWPLFGWYARRAGALFVRRARRRDVQRTGEAMRRALEDGALVVLFPEGTTSDGGRVLPFASSLFEPACDTGCPVWAGCVAFELEQGEVGWEVCYWGDMVLLPHLMRLLGRRGLQARLRFTAVRAEAVDRKELGRCL